MNSNYLALLICLTTIIFTGCNRGNDEKNGSGFVNKQKWVAPNIVQTVSYGDSAKLVVEKRGDTLVKHFIDLTGLKRHGFDDSYTAVCVYKDILNNALAKNDAYLKEGDYTIYFDRKTITHFCDSARKSKGGNTENQFVITMGGNFTKFNRGGDWGPASFNTDLILNCPGHMVNNKTNKPVKSILVEFYSTEFSGGENFSVITESGDTLAWFHHNLYMK